MLATKLLVPLMLLLTLGFSRPITDQLAFAPGSPGPVTFEIVAVGDTVKYRIGWGPGDHATSYLFTTAVTATNGSWLVVADSNISGKWITGPGIGPLPATGEITSTTYKSWLTAATWDSATFSVTVASKNAGGLSATSTGFRRIMRPPGPPGPVTIDSALVLTGLPVFPATAMMIVGTDRVTCGFFQFGNGAIVERTIDRSSCDTIYWKYVPLDAQTVTAAQQAFVDTSTVP